MVILTQKVIFVICFIYMYMDPNPALKDFLVLYADVATEGMVGFLTF
jgi:hypothetical protein